MRNFHAHLCGGAAGEIVPGAGFHALAVLETGDDEPVLRAGERHIEKTAALALRRFVGFAFRGAHGGGRFVVGQRENHIAVRAEEKFAVPARALRQGGGVGQNDDIRFQTLGAMHRHHPHFVAAAIHVALDLRFAAFEPVQEPFQRRRVVLLIGEREGSELVQRIRRFGAEACQQFQPRLLFDKRMGIEFVRRFAVRASAHLLEKFVRAPESRRFAGAFLERPPQPLAFAAISQFAQLVLADVDERRAEQGGEIEVVFRQQHEAAQRHHVHHRDLLGELHAVRARDRNLLLLQAADNLAGKRLPARHEDHNVAGTDGLVAAGQAPALDDPFGDLRGDAIGQLRNRTRLGFHVDGFEPVVI